MREKDIGRFQAVCNDDKVVVPTKVEITEAPKWDVYENNHFAMRKRLVNIFLKVANRLIIRQRAGKRLMKMKKRFEEKKVANREDAKRLVAEDWKESLNMRVGGDDNTDNIQNVRFEFSFNKKTIHKMSEIRLPLEYETNIASFMEKIDAQPIINFDDLEAFDPIE